MVAQETNGKAEINEEERRVPNDSKVPGWLEAELFEDILKENVPGYKNVKNFKAYPAMAPGENYATIMLRVEIEMELQENNTQSISFMLKIGHDHEQYKEILASYDMFETERGVFLEIIPELEQLYRDIGKEVKFGAKCYKLPVEKPHVLLEDLRPRGFKNANRLEGLDVEHTKCVLKKLALWHAASACRVEAKGKYADIYTYGIYQESQRQLFKSVNENMGKFLLESLKDYKSSEIYMEAIAKLEEQATDKLFQAMEIDPKEFNVLNHGDCWTNNIMFQYDPSGKIQETYFVDYQIPKYGSVAQDLIYFIISSTSYDIKIKQFEYFIKFYHDQLIEALALLKYPKKMPTLKEIHQALYKYGIWGYRTVVLVMSAVLLDPNERANIEHFLTDNEEGNKFKRLLFSNARYRKHAEALLPWLYYRGALEC